MSAAANAPTLPVFIIRPATEDDWNFIRSSWMRSFADSAFAKAVVPAYWVGHMRVRDRLLARCGAVVASLDSAPTSVCAWACFEEGTIHYVYVRARWERLGLAKQLLEPFAMANRVVYTHKTRIINSDSLPEHWHYNPYDGLLDPKDIP